MTPTVAIAPTQLDVFVIDGDGPMRDKPNQHRAADPARSLLSRTEQAQAFLRNEPTDGR
jgi:hypothetical protein